MRTSRPNPLKRRGYSPHSPASTYSITAHAYDLFVSTRGLDRHTRGARFVACISDYNRRFLEARSSATGPEYPVVHCGVPTREMRRPAHAPSTEATRLIMVSSFQPKKGHAVLVEALRSSPPLQTARLDLVGEGPLEPTVKSLVLRAGLGHRVTFHGGQAEDAVRRMIAGSDVLVQPSVLAANGDMDGIPNTLIEAMALGIPVVTTAVSGIPELVIDGVTGVVVETGRSRRSRCRPSEGDRGPGGRAEARRWRARQSQRRVRHRRLGSGDGVIARASPGAGRIGEQQDPLLGLPAAPRGAPIVIWQGLGSYFHQAAHRVRGIRERRWATRRHRHPGGSAAGRDPLGSSTEVASAREPPWAGVAGGNARAAAAVGAMLGRGEVKVAIVPVAALLGLAVRGEFPRAGYVAILWSVGDGRRHARASGGRRLLAPVHAGRNPALDRPGDRLAFLPRDVRRGLESLARRRESVVMASRSSPRSSVALRWVWRTVRVCTPLRSICG